MLEVRDLSVRYGRTVVLENVNFTLDNGQWLMVVGPNGAGKSTLVGAVAQNIGYTGRVLCGGENVAKMRARDRARHIGVLTQNHFVSYAFTVKEIVRLGRYAYSHGPLSAESCENAEQISHALEITGMAPLAGQSVLTLSGGEIQRTFLAQLFAQNPELLILDEPTNHLDLAYQKQVFALVKEWIAQTGRAVLSVVHDLSLARAYGTQALLLNGGHTVAIGDVCKVLTRENLHRVYSMDVYEWMQEMLSLWKDEE